MKFSTMGLAKPILNAIEKQGYDTPSPIQNEAIPAVLKGRDVMAAAQTGTGKTAGFTLPMLHLLSKGKPARSNQARALILTPTRELAAQVGDSVNTYGRGLSLRSTQVFGGVKINPQMMRLRKGVDILVATPGRLLDLYNQNAVRFDNLEMIVLDEADRMLDMGFIHDIRKIIALLPEKRQNLMFSATFSDEIRKLAAEFIHNPVEISVSPKNTTAKTVKQWIHPVDKKRKPDLLIELIEQEDWYQVLVFSRTRHGADRLAKKLLQHEIKAAAIHGNKSQGARTQALRQFKKGQVQVLVATDIAARGLDIEQLPQVVNFDLPDLPEDYVHRIGRTGRAGAKGHAISLVSADEVHKLAEIEHLIKQLLKRELVDGFEPDHDVPITTLESKPYNGRNPKASTRARRSSQKKRKPATRKNSRNQSTESAGESRKKTVATKRKKVSAKQRENKVSQGDEGDHKRSRARKKPRRKVAAGKKATAKRTGKTTGKANKNKSGRPKNKLAKAGMHPQKRSKRKFASKSKAKSNKRK